MENFILYVVAICFTIGAIDYIFLNKFNLGVHFEEGVKNMGPLAISMIGIISLTPIIVDVLNKYLVPLASKLNLDPSIFTSSIIAVDMGGFNIAESISLNQSMAEFSGILIASILGCTLSFTLPLALGIVKRENMEFLTIGMLFGIITIPIGIIIGGIMLKIPFKTVIINTIPIIILSIIICFLIVFFKGLVLKVFTFIGRGIVTLSIIGFVFVGIKSITGIEIIKGLMPLDESIKIVGGIAIFLGGAYVMLQILKNILKGPLDRLGKRFGVNNDSIAAFLGSFASAIIVFVNFDKLDDKGKIICSAFSVGGAYSLGGQLGFVSGEAKDIIGIYILVKLICGFSAVILSIIYINKTEILHKG